MPQTLGKGSEGEKRTTTETATVQIEPGVESTMTFSKDWYYHRGSAQGDTKYDAGWYGVEEYKKILTGTTKGATESIQLNIRLAIGDFVGRDEQEITEKDFTTEQLIELRKIVLGNVSRGKMRIDYEDYVTTQGTNPYADVTHNGMNIQGTSNSDRLSKRNDPRYILKTIFGQASIIVENGKLYVVDQYNFNDAKEAQSGKSGWEIFNAWRKGSSTAGKDIYKQFRNMGTYYGSQEGEGSKFKIYIPKFQ